MAISTSVPSTTRKPGIFHEFDLLSGARGLTPLENPILLLGEQLAGGTATADVFEEIFDENQADDLFGAGSNAALMCRQAIATMQSAGVGARLYAAGVADPAGTAATYTITVTGSATGDGDIVFRVAGRTIRAGVSDGDAQNTIATAIKDAVDGVEGILPVTAGVATNVVTLTARQTGVNGNDIDVVIDDVGLTGTSVVAAAAVAGVGVASFATALSNSLSKYFLVKAVSNHAAADITAWDTHLDAAWASAAKRWCFGITGENGTLSAANALSSAANDFRQIVVNYEDGPNLPGELAAAMAVAVATRSQPNYNWDGFELPLFTPPDASVFTDAEIESALSAGTTPLAPNDQRTKTEIVRAITTKTTEGGNPFENAKDVGAINGIVAVTRQMDATFSQQFKAVNKSAQVLKRMRSVAFDVLKAFEEIEVTQNVTELFPQLQVESDPIVATRAIVSLPESIIPALHQIILVHVLIVE